MRARGFLHRTVQQQHNNTTAAVKQARSCMCWPIGQSPGGDGASAKLD